MTREGIYELSGTSISHKISNMKKLRISTAFVPYGHIYACAIDLLQSRFNYASCEMCTQGKRTWTITIGDGSGALPKPTTCIGLTLPIAICRAVLCAHFGV